MLAIVRRKPEARVATNIFVSLWDSMLFADVDDDDDNDDDVDVVEELVFPPSTHIRVLFLSQGWAHSSRLF